MFHCPVLQILRVYVSVFHAAKVPTTDLTIEKDFCIIGEIISAESLSIGVTNHGAS